MKPIVTAILGALLAAAAISAARAEPAGLQVKVCPGRALHAYPLAPGTRFQSLVVPNVAVANAGAAPLELNEIDFELLDKGAVVDTRRLTGEGLRAVLNSGPAVEAALKMIPFQFCDGALLGEQPKMASGAVLAPAQQALIGNQTFGWKGSRDTLRITVVARRGEASEHASVSVAVSADTVKTPLVFPLAGRWFVAVAGTPHGGHRWALPEAFAYDIVRMGDDDRSFRGQGTKFSDYYAYGAQVLAAGDGVVAEVVDDQPEDPNVLRRPGEGFDAYGDRSGAIQMALLKKGDRAVGGNSVLIDHGDGEYSLYAHLKPGSIGVKPGQRVKAGQPIARLGGSGNSTEPHLHFQVCDGPSALHCAGVPLAFTNVELPYADGPRAIQAGDIVLTR